MELEMRFGKAYIDDEYVGKIMCSDPELFDEWLQGTGYDKYEITEEEYERLS